MSTKDKKSNPNLKLRTVYVGNQGKAVPSLLETASEISEIAESGVITQKIFMRLIFRLMGRSDITADRARSVLFDSDILQRQTGKIGSLQQITTGEAVQNTLGFMAWWFENNSENELIECQNSFDFMLSMRNENQKYQLPEGCGDFFVRCFQPGYLNSVLENKDMPEQFLKAVRFLHDTVFLNRLGSPEGAKFLIRHVDSLQSLIYLLLFNNNALAFNELGVFESIVIDIEKSTTDVLGPPKDGEREVFQLLRSPKSIGPQYNSIARILKLDINFFIIASFWVRGMQPNMNTKQWSSNFNG